MKLTIIAALLLASPTPALAGTVSGSARIIDGDTLEIGSQRIRLFGIECARGNTDVRS